MKNMDKEERKINLEGTINTRDLGGYLTLDNRRVKRRMFIRSDSLDQLSLSDISVFEREYHLRFDVDLRSQGEIDEKKDKEIPGCLFIHAPITKELSPIKRGKEQDLNIADPALKGIIGYIYFLDENGDISKAMENVYLDFLLSSCGRENYSLLFKTMLKLKDGESLLFHCKDGKDRTGVAAALFLSILNVPEKVVIEDYLLTNKMVEKKAKAREQVLRDVYLIKDEVLINSAVSITGVRPNWIEATLNKIKEDYGDVENYFLKGLNFTKEEITKLRDIALEST